VETQFGYHIIVIENKMPLYKIANLAKDIKASKETENKVIQKQIHLFNLFKGKASMIY
jgi:peptidyl-prolyl cis-trans isomerase D